MPVTSRRAKPEPKILAERRELAEERLKIARKRKPDDAKVAKLDARLKQIATWTGASFKEVFGKDSVSVSGAVDSESKGEQPVLQTEAWLALTELERRRLNKSYPGLIKVEQQWGRASGGRVTVKVV
jgi:hypothetical protein